MPALSEGYEATRARIAGVVDGADPDVPVPASTGWRVHDVVAHLCGVAEALAGRPAAADASVSVDTLLGRWDEAAPAAGAAIDAGHHGAFVDAVVREHDLRAALDQPGARGVADVRAALTLQLEALGGPLKAARLGALVVDGGGVAWTSHFARAGCTLRADPWAATRVLAGRRTAEEIRALVVAGDVEPYLAALDALHRLPVTSLGETA